MAIELQNFASGDTDYIAKMNQNNTELVNAINGLITQIGSIGGSGSALSSGTYIDNIFNKTDGLVGPSSYAPTKSASTLIVSPGAAYLKDEQQMVMSLLDVPLSFLGYAAGTYYIMVDASGTPRIVSEPDTPGTLYSVVWNGSSFGAITYLMKVGFDVAEADAARRSVVFKGPGETQRSFGSLDARLEFGELYAKDANTKADQALEIAYDLQASISAPYRKVGVTVDGAGGVKGAIQIDFDGTIVGWSCIADAAGTLQVEVSRKASSAPPAPPQVPNPMTDRISGSTPIALAGAQSAARDEVGVGSWDTSLSKWDVIQFTTVAVSGITKATLYLRILEDLPSPPDISSPVGFDALEE